MTESGTTTKTYNPSLIVVYTPAGTTTTTSYASTATETETPIEYSSIVETNTLSTSCTSTVYTATASATATQTAKCAPKNLVSNVEFINYREGTSYSNSEDFFEGEASKDASACCQACQDNDNCIASQFSESDSRIVCTNFYADEGKCPAIALSVERGEPGYLSSAISIAPGCGEIKEDRR